MKQCSNETMKESELYINFLKRNWLWFILPLIISLLLSIYFYAQVPSKVKISQTFKMEYELQNIDTILALTDQAVAQLRAQRFSDLFDDSEALIYKSAPLSINIDAVSSNRNLSYALLVKEVEYLKQNFNVGELTSPQITQVEPNLFKYLISGLIVGGLIGLMLSLVREYLKNY